MALKKLAHRTKNPNSKGTTFNWSSGRLSNFKAYQYSYSKTHYRDFHIRLDVDKDKDVIEYIDRIPELTKYVRNAVRLQIAIESNKNKNVKNKPKNRAKINKKKK